MKRAAALALAVLLPLSSGCVAAAIPLAAGAVVARTQTAGRPAESAPPLAASPVGGDGQSRLIPTTLTALPAPAAAPGANRAVEDFARYAGDWARAGAGTRKRESALLKSAGELRPVRGECGNRPIAVFIDLDPGRASFDPLSPGKADGELAASLSQLRGEGITVVWFSRLGENFAEAARAALRDSGLDPADTDQLVLMRDISERKQSLRDEIAATLCPIAMLGDERADFDELYLYLRNPDGATALDAMIGRGWFLASPFSSASTDSRMGAKP